MIRYPSDGTVRDVSIETEQAALVCDQHSSLPAASGLPLESQKPEAQAKLEKSRAWLKDYFHRKPEQGA